jgi:hypothetical protein
MPPLPVLIIDGMAEPLIPPLPLVVPPVPVGIAVAHPVGPGIEPSGHVIGSAVVFELPSPFEAHAASARKHDHHHAGARTECVFTTRTPTQSRPPC